MIFQRKTSFNRGQNQMKYAENEKIKTENKVDKIKNKKGFEISK